MLQYEQIEFLSISRQNYRQKRPKTLVIQGLWSFFRQVIYFTKLRFAKL